MQRPVSPSRTRPTKSLASIRFGLSLVLNASRSLTISMMVLQLAAAAAVAGQLFFLARIAVLLETEPDQALNLGWSSILGFTAMLIIVIGINQLSLEVRVLLAEILEREVMGQLLQTAGEHTVADFEDADFHDRLVRARRSARRDLIRIVTGAILVLRSTLQLLAVGVVLVWIAPIVLVVSMLAAVPLILSARVNTKSLYRHAYDLTGDDRRRTYLEQMLLSRRHAAELQMLGARKNLGARVGVLRDMRIDRTRDVVRRRATTSIFAGVVSAVVAGTAIAVLVREVTQGRLQLAEAAVAVVALQQVRGRSTELSSAVSGLHDAGAFVSDFHDFVDQPSNSQSVSETTDGPGVAHAGGAPRIELTNLSFTYPNASEPALSELNLVIEPGSLVAVVGENGSGKSTLAKLISGVYSPTRGEICWDGASEAPEVSSILQDFARFELSGWDNIALGEPDRPLDEERGRGAARAAEIARVLDGLPEGFDTVLSREYSGGTELSGGEWQRLAIGRGFYRRAPLLVLDEPTSALDARAEAALLVAIRQQAADRTVVIISHRFATVRDADLIVVLHGGALEEVGSHEELMANEARYAELFRLQAGPFFDSK